MLILEKFFQLLAGFFGQLQGQPNYRNTSSGSNQWNYDEGNNFYETNRHSCTHPFCDDANDTSHDHCDDDD